MKKKIAELKEARAKVLADQRDLYTKADEEKRGLNVDEQATYGNLETRFDELSTEIKQLDADLERR